MLKVKPQLAKLPPRRGDSLLRLCADVGSGMVYQDRKAEYKRAGERHS